MRKSVVGLALGVGLSFLALGRMLPAQVQFNTAGAGAKTADIESAVRLICPASKISHGKDEKVSGCETCPRGTDFYGQGKSKWEVYAATPGYFTSPRDDGLLIDGQGCDSDARENGGTFVFAINAGKVKLIRYEKGLITDECIKFAFADGRDGLVCRDGSYLQGEGDERVFVTSFDATGKSMVKTLLHATDTTGTCGGYGTQTVRRWEFTDIQLARAPGGETTAGRSAQITGLMVQERIGNVACSEIAKERKSKAGAASVKTYTVRFTFDGRQFKMDPASKVVVQELAG